MSALAEYTVTAARRFSTGKSLETDGHNNGPEIRDWLSDVGIHAPAPWCAAFACAMIREAAAALHLPPPIYYSASALRLLALNESLVTDQPEPGHLIVFDHGGGLGHVGIVTGVTSVGGNVASVQAIAGNTTLAGSREGNAVVERGFDLPDPRLAGYVRVS
jgi:hypothetical protein